MEQASFVVSCIHWDDFDNRTPSLKWPNKKGTYLNITSHLIMMGQFHDGCQLFNSVTEDLSSF